MPRTGLTKDQSLRKIIELAEKKIRKTGFNNLKLTQLAKELGVSHAALYKHISSKEALLDLISEEWLLEIDDRLKCISKEPIDAYELLLKWFTTYHKLKLDKIRKDPEIYKTFNMAVEKKKDFVQKHLNELTDQLAHIVERGKESKMFRRYSTSRTVNLFMDSTASFHHPVLVVEQQGKDRIQELKNLLDTIVRGLNADPYP